MASVTIGRYRNASGPDLAVVGYNEQLASFTIGHSSVEHTLTDMGAWMGKYTGSPIVRLVLFWEHSDGRPGGVAGFTNEITLTHNYTGALGGAMYTASLVSDVVVPAGHKLRVGVTCRNGQAGIAMIQASQITETNELFYRKDITGNTPVDGVGSATSTQGQLMIHATGFTGTTSGGGNPAPTNSIPYAPELISVGDLAEGDLTPVLSFKHRDPDGNNSSAAKIEVRRKSDSQSMWVHSWSVNVPNNGQINAVYSSATGLTYGTTYQYRAQTTDSVGNIGPMSGWVDFVIYQANVAPNAPDQLSPAILEFDAAGLKPTMSMRHVDLNGDVAKRYRMKVRKKGTTTLLLNVDTTCSVASGSKINRTYDGAALSYYTEYEFSGQTNDGKVWSLEAPWVTFSLKHINRAPDVPVAQSPLPSSFLKPADVTASGFKWKFSDPDALLPGMSAWEKSSTAEVSIRVKGSSTYSWQSGALARVVADEASITVPYTGASNVLQYNKDYEVLYTHKDRRGASATLVLPMRFDTGGTVAKPRLPSGRTTNHANPGNVYATYSETDALGSNATRIRIVQHTTDPKVIADKTYTPIKTSGDLLGTFTSGVEFNRPWSDIAYSIPYGTTVGVQVQNRITATGEWTEWSPPSWVTGNAPPEVPRLTAPANETATGVKPTLVALVQDKDQTPSELSVTFQISTDPAFATFTAIPGVRQTGTNTINADAEFRASTSAVTMAFNTEYYFRAYSYDGFLYSGGATTTTNATKSTPRHFLYADAPVVTVTSPTTIATMTPTFSWTTTKPQTKYHIILRDTEGNAVYDSGEITSTELFHQSVQAYWKNNDYWANGEKLNLSVGVLSGIWGWSNPVAITLVYSIPDSPTSVVATPVRPEGHEGTPKVTVTHDISTYAIGVFAAYRYYRTPIAGPGGADIGPRVLLSINTDISDPQLDDWTFESGQWYRWDVTILTVNGLDEVESLPVGFEAMGSWRGLVLSIPYNPNDYNIHLRMAPPGSMYEVQVTRRKAKRAINGAGLRRRVASIGKRREIDAKAAFSLRRDDACGLTGRQMHDRLIALMDFADGTSSPDGRPHTICWREGRGGPDSVLFGSFSEQTEVVADGRSRDLWITTLDFQDSEFVLGEVI